MFIIILVVRGTHEHTRGGVVRHYVQHLYHLQWQIDVDVDVVSSKVARGVVQFSGVMCIRITSSDLLKPDVRREIFPDHSEISMQHLPTAHVGARTTLCPS